MKRFRVVYAATFECTVECGPDEDEQDAVSCVDIPEGGEHGSVYCEDTFEILETVELPLTEES